MKCQFCDCPKYGFFRNASFDVTTCYDDYDVYRQFEQPLVQAGWDVIVFVPSHEEDSDRITCGNALIASV